MAQKGRWSVAVYELVAGSSTPLLRVAKLLSLRLCPVWCGAREIRPLKTSLGFEGIRAAESLRSSKLDSNSPLASRVPYFSPSGRLP